MAYTASFLVNSEIAIINELIASYGLLWAKESILAECESIAKRYTCPFDIYSIAHGVCAAKANRELSSKANHTARLEGKRK